VLTVLLRFTESDNLFGIFKLFLSFFSFCHCGKKKKGQEEFEDTKGVIGFRKSKKDRQHNDRKKKLFLSFFFLPLCISAIDFKIYGLLLPLWYLQTLLVLNLWQCYIFVLSLSLVEIYPNHIYLCLYVFICSYTSLSHNRFIQ
jgi:hypothetical protein